MLQSLANLADLIAALAVFGSLIYLAREVHHATHAARCDAHHRFNQSVLSILGDIARDPELHRIWHEGLLKEGTLNDVERDRLGMVLFQMFGAYSAAHQAALVDSELTELSQVALDQFLQTPGVRLWWSRQGGNFLASFQDFVNARMAHLAAQAESEAAAAAGAEPRGEPSGA